MASTVIGSSPSNVLLYRVKEVYGSGTKGIEYAGSWEGLSVLSVSYCLRY